MRKLVVLALVFALTGCASIPVLDNRAGNEYEVDTFCTRIQTVGDSKANTSTVWGISTGLLGGSSLLVGTVVGDDPTQKTYLRRHPGVPLNVIGGALTAISIYLFSRATPAAKASADASLAMSESDIAKRRARCLAARSAWTGSREDSAELMASVTKATLDELQSNINQVVQQKADQAVGAAVEAMRPQIATKAELETMLDKKLPGAVELAVSKRLVLPTPTLPKEGAPSERASPSEK